jgi:hypothetical protein
MPSPHWKASLRIFTETIIESTAENIIRNKGSTEINRLCDNGLVAVIVAISLSNNVSSTTRMEGSSNRQLEVAEHRIGSINFRTVMPLLEDQLVPILSAYGWSATT